MNAEELIFLNILKAGIHNEKMPADLCLPANPSGWETLFVRAEEQSLLPLVVDAVCNAYAAHARVGHVKEEIAAKADETATDPKAAAKDILRRYKEIAVEEAIRQIVQTNEFLTLLLHMQASGLDPVVLKGITVRSLYPKPMLRPSVDEDLLIPREDAEKYHEFLLSEGLFIDEPGIDRSTAAEWSYHKENSPTYIEIHVNLFEPTSEAYGDFDKLFENVAARTISVHLEDVTARTLCPTDHLMFLFCHALKHFLHGGLGIRPVCDMCLYIDEYHEQISWEEAAKSCDKIKMSKFAVGLLRICVKHLGLADDVISGPLAKMMEEVDETDLLEDILTAGLYGTASLERMHSSTLTLQAAANAKSGKSESKNFIRTVFPTLRSMQVRFSYLYKYPWLLPAAWIQRIFRYAVRKAGKSRSKPIESIKIGKSRIELLREYGVIE